MPRVSQEPNPKNKVLVQTHKDAQAFDVNTIVISQKVGKSSGVALSKNARSGGVPSKTSVPKVERFTVKAGAGHRKEVKVEASQEQVVVTKAVTRAFDQLAMSVDEASAVIGVQTPVFSQMIGGKEYLETQSKPFELALIFIRIFKQLDAMFGGDLKAASEWLRSFNSAIGAVPVIKITSIAGLCDVLAYLEGRHGAV